MLLTVEELRAKISSNCSGLVQELQQLTGRYGKAEADAWSQSLPKLEQAFSSPGFQPLHMYFGSRGNLALEYQLPASSSWCDVVLLGKHQDRAAAVVLELKDWTTAGTRPGRAPGLIEHRGNQTLHPSEQVRGYVEYCRKYHSTVEDYGATVHGCVLFTREPYTHAFTEQPNSSLCRDFPVFTLYADDIQKNFPDFFASRLTEPDSSFAEQFEKGRYRQRRGFVAQIGKQILNPETSPFELLDGQRLAFALSWAVIEETFLNTQHQEPQKRVIIIEGPPGSGKSVIAARLWASLVTDSRLPDGDVVFTSTSMSQNSNWSHLFEQTTSEKAARGIVKKATGFTPIQTADLGRLRGKHGKSFLGDASLWRENLTLIRNMGVPFRSGSYDSEHLVSIVDEAHALINPEHNEGRGQFGFVVALGPQAYHIIRSSTLTIFLLDAEQGFRLRENTTVEDITKWSVELGAGEPERISLEGAQFRCAGSAEYVEWVEAFLDGQVASRNAVLARAWYAGLSTSEIKPYGPIETDIPIAAESGTPQATVYNVVPRNSEPSAMLVSAVPNNYLYDSCFDFRIFNDPASLELELNKRIEERHTVRLLSTYSREWKTSNAANPHSLPPGMQDFHEPYLRDGKRHVWSRPWNFVPNGDYSWFITGKDGSRIAEDPLCEVGCPYAVRGFDYDYVGLLWLDDLVWRNGKWKVSPSTIHESGITNLTRRAAKEQGMFDEGPATKELIKRVTQAYRILLTRALKGLYLWVPDDETRNHLHTSLIFRNKYNEI